jgi:hypothetical protein
MALGTLCRFCSRQKARGVPALSDALPRPRSAVTLLCEKTGTTAFFPRFLEPAFVA